MYPLSSLITPFVVNNFLIPLSSKYRSSGCSSAKFSATVTSNSSTAYMSSDQTTPSIFVTRSVRQTHDYNDYWTTKLIVAHFTENARAIDSLEGLDQALKAFTIGSACAVLACLLLSVGCFRSYESRLARAPEATESSSCIVKENKNCNLRYFYFGLITLMMVCWSYTSSVLIQYLQTFSIVGLKWSTKEASFLNAVFGGGQVAGNLAAIIFSNLVAEYTLFALAIFISIASVGILLMLFSGIGFIINATIMIGTALAGDYLLEYNVKLNTYLHKKLYTHVHEQILTNKI